LYLFTSPYILSHLAAEVNAAALTQKPSRAAKPTGFGGRIAARIMSIAHSPIYKSVAAALKLQPEDDFLEK